MRSGKSASGDPNLSTMDDAGRTSLVYDEDSEQWSGVGHHTFKYADC
jgi:hypothetical protein